jgi:peroxiredoxin
MAIQTGDRIPESNLGIMTDDGPALLNTSELFSGKKVLLFAVPGAFTPTCSARHLPGFIDLLDEFHAAGVDTVACVSVNDVYVMNAWSQSAGAEGIQMLADGNADFARALGLDVDASAFNMGTRSHRFALVAEDGVVTRLFVESPGAFEVSSAEHVLANL